jgi:3-oxoacyl-[acyl-carrier protein] reductase
MSQGTASFNFSGARVLITGGTSGIGLATAIGFADAGAEVVITGTRSCAGDYDVELGRFDYRQLLVDDNEAIVALADSLAALDVLVNNAGNAVFAEEDTAAARIAAFQKMVQVHLTSGNTLAEACRDKLSASGLPGGASIVGIASLTSFLANPHLPGYGAGKAGMVQLAKTQAQLWSGKGIRSNCVAAGNIVTGMTAGLQEVDELHKPMMARTPMSRWGKAEEIADAVMFLSSDKASFITGETLVVDGGYLGNL